MSMLDLEALTDLRDKEYAHEYMDEFLNESLATQIKVLREQNGWTQEQLAEEAGMFQERISVLENVNNSSWNSKTLKKLARAFDLRLHVSFENFTTELEHFDNFTFDAIVRKKSLERIPRAKDIALAEKRIEDSKRIGAVSSTNIDIGYDEKQKSKQKLADVVYLSDRRRSNSSDGFTPAQELQPLKSYGY